MSRRKPEIQTADDALVFLDYMATFTKGVTSSRCSEIASVIRELVSEVEGDERWVVECSPRDVVAALMQRAWDEDTTDDDKILLETAAGELADSLDRNIRLAQVIEKSGVGL
jgi:hypothetical protein